MADQGEKARRKAILQSQRENKWRSVRGDLPVAVPVLKALFDHVSAQLESSECDNTLKHAVHFIREHDLPEEAVVAWLKDNHGYCDCETLWNSEEVVEEAVPGYRDIEPST